MKKPDVTAPKVIRPEDSGPPGPPPELVRPRNGDRSGDALGIDKFSGPDGGGLSPFHFVPLVDEPPSKR